MFAEATAPGCGSRQPGLPSQGAAGGKQGSNKGYDSVVYTKMLCVKLEKNTTTPGIRVQVNCFCAQLKQSPVHICDAHVMQAG